jgi:hypothetical membrane protein
MTDRHMQGLSTGAVLWILNVQYFIMQLVVAAAWTGVSYSWANNTISDLANTRCGAYGARSVCSPLHTAMNISFVVLGVTIVSGAILLQRKLALSSMGRLGFGCMAAAGLGAMLVGLFPENSVSGLHIGGAALSFLLGNLGMIVLAVDLKRLPKVFRIYTALSGVIGLFALVLFLKQSYLGLGIGGMERIVAYPQTIWMIVVGAYLLLSRPGSPASSGSKNRPGQAA